MIENPKTIAAVIGHPIHHSRSPLIHNYWLSKTGREGTYTTIDVQDAHLAAFCSAAIEAKLKGFNVTLPHKQAIMAHCDEVDETARSIGAVNTVHIKDGTLFGTNTDAYGFLENLRQGVSHFDFEAGSAIVMGAGGAARAVIYALLKQGTPHIILVNRTKEKADTLAQSFERTEVAAWQDLTDIMSETNLVVNTTSLGMAGQPDLLINPVCLPTDAVCYDLVYNPLQTTFLKTAAAKRCPALGGLGMLVYQAQKAFELWFDETPLVDKTLMQKLKASL